MNPKIEKLTMKTLNENLVDFLPEWQRIFSHFPSYFDLTSSVFEWIENPSEENYQLFIHKKMIFDDLCEKDPEGIKEKNIIKKKKFENERNLHLDDLLKKHKEEYFK